MTSAADTLLPHRAAREWPETLVIGGAGAIGSRLIAALVARDGPGTVLAGLRRSALPPDLAEKTVCEFGVDVRDAESVRALIDKYRHSLKRVWNLAAPLSVDTAKDPKAAHDIVVGGMKVILEAMREAGVTQMLFSDSIGSYGADAPREQATARWLVEHPTQDPGSDYGRQKRACRELMRAYAEKHGFDCRWAVIPGVLHGDAVWGGGTTEYALDAIKCAFDGTTFTCPVPYEMPLPMIMADDLIVGLLALQDAQKSALGQPECGYAMSGFSFTPLQLFEEIKRHRPGFEHNLKLDPDAANFATLWPNSISPDAALRDLHFEATVGLRDAVDMIFAAHRSRDFWTSFGCVFCSS